MNFNLQFKSKEVLVNELKAMVADERRLQTQILHYLLEVEERELYLPAYQNLFDFVTLELGYSEPAANRRIQAMRLMREVPEVEEKLETGKISLSVAARAQSFIRQENKKRKEERKELISRNEKLELVQQLEGTSARECEKKLIAMAPETAIPREKTKPLTEDKTLIQFVADGQLMKKIEKLKNLLAHQNYEGRYDKLFEKVVDMALEKLDPEQREMRRMKKTPTTTSESDVIASPEGAKQSRYIPQTIRDQVWVRDHGECQYRDPVTGRICGSKHGVQLDHIKPYSQGGDHSPQNLRLLCGSHNRYRAERGGKEKNQPFIL